MHEREPTAFFIRQDPQELSYCDRAPLCGPNTSKQSYDPLYFCIYPHSLRLAVGRSPSPIEVSEAYAVYSIST
jgi:hypothetical protein